MKKKFILTLIALCMSACAFAACGGSGSSGGGASVESGSSLEQPSLEFSQNKLELILGESKQAPSLSLLDGETVSYSCNDTSIAIVSETGVIEGKGVGSAVVKATTSTGRTALVQIIVYDPTFYPVPHISVAQDKFALSVGDSFALAYTYTYLNQEIDGEVSISADNDSVVTIEGNLIKAVGVGETTVTLSGSSIYGTATKTVKISVTEKQVEFSASFVGKEIYVGSNIELAVYVNENGEVKKVDGATFSVTDEGLATIESGELVPLAGGDTEISVDFTYGGVAYSKQIPVHIYGLNTCSFYFADGSLDHSLQAVYGDIVPLYIENSLDNPEYNKTIKCWYINGELFDGEEFVMPDETVEVSVRYVNETEDDFTASFSKGSLLGDAQAVVAYVDEPLVDGNGASSDLSGYMQFTANFSSLCFNFDEPVVVNDYAKVKMRMYVPKAVNLLYFGYATNENWSKENPTKRYEASAGKHKTGDVPLAVIENDKWIVLEMPLSAFVDEIGDTLKGISISISNASIYIDYVSLDLGLALNDPIYMDNVLMQDIENAENGSDAQAAAVVAYKAWSSRLTEEQKATETHQANVAKINALLKEYFAGKKVTNVLLNDPIVDTTRGAVDQNERIQTGWGGIHTEYKTEYKTYVHMIQFASGDFDGTATLPVMNYNEHEEVYFGLFAIASQNGTVSILGQSYSFDNTKGHSFKVIIKNGVLTMMDDSQKQNDGGGVIFTATLPEEIANGTAGLVIDFQFDAWSQAEITEMHTLVSLESVD